MPAVPPTVVGVGQASIELIGLVDRYPEIGTTNDLRQFSIQGGGAVATALSTAAVLGERVALVAAVSDDDFGRFILDGLRAVGVDVSRVVVQPGRVSPLEFVIVEQGARGPVVLRTAGNVDPLPATAIDTALVAGAKTLLVDGQQLAAQIAACEIARAHGVPVLLDAGSLREGLGELIALCDVLVASEGFATEIAPRGEIEDSLVEIAQMGPRVVVVTLGEDGAVGLEGEKLVRTRALDLEVVDTTGAGDVYRGAFAYGLAQRWTLEKCMQFANAAAGLKCRWLGARAGLPTLDAVKQAAWGGTEP